MLTLVGKRCFHRHRAGGEQSPNRVNQQPAGPVGPSGARSGLFVLKPQNHRHRAVGGHHKALSNQAIRLAICSYKVWVKALSVNLETDHVD